MIIPENNDLYDLNEALKSENLTNNDYEEICKRLNRKPNRTELGMFGVMWSEHCCYRNSKPLLSKFPTKGKNVLVGPGENAGVIDVGNNQKLVFKIESLIEQNLECLELCGLKIVVIEIQNLYYLIFQLRVKMF